MSIRLPRQGVGSFIDVDSGTASVAGGVAHQFTVPQDTDNIVVKMVASLVGGSASTVLQTSDDGGTTWFDIARTSVVSNGVPQFLSAATISSGVRTGVTFGPNSIISAGIGAPAASTLGSQQVSGLPILGVVNRVFTIYSGTPTVASVVTTVSVNQQSATA